MSFSQFSVDRVHVRVHDRSQLAMVLLLACCLSLGAILAGCSKEKIQSAIEDAKAQTRSLTKSTAEVISNQLPQSGKLALESTPPIAPIEQLQLELIQIGDSRPSVVQIASYDVRAPGRSFPAIMLHGTTSASTTSSLLGETIECDVYYQEITDASIAMTKPGESISVTFDSFNEEDNVVNATLGSVDLLTSDDQTISIRGGTIVAVVKAEGS